MRHTLKMVIPHSVSLMKTLRWPYLVIYLSSSAIPSFAQSAASYAYTPVTVTCPSSGSLVRFAGTDIQRLSIQESAYIAARKSSVLPSAWSTYLSNVETYAGAQNIAIPDYVHQLLSASEVPDGMTVGLAISGGAYRAAIVCGVIMNAFDARNTAAIQAGTGGLLQGVSYLSGLSGGGWLVASTTQAGFPTFPDLVYGAQSEHSSGETGSYGGFLAQIGFIGVTPNTTNEKEYLLDLVEETQGKKSAGFSTTATDVWARILARRFVNGTTSHNFFNRDIKHGAGLLWSDTSKVCVTVRYIFSP